MGNPETDLCEKILEEFFGPEVAAVGRSILVYGVKTLGQTCSDSGLSVKKVKACISILVHHDILTFSDKRKPGAVDYVIQKARILSLLRLPRFISCMEELYGGSSALLLATVARCGRITASQLLVNVLQIEKEKQTEGVTVYTLDKQLRHLVTQKIFKRCAAVKSPDTEIPELIEDPAGEFTFPTDLNLKQLESGGGDDSEYKDKSILWTLNLDRLDQILRDTIIQEGAERRVDESAGRILKSVLAVSSELYDGWAISSGHLGSTLLCDRIKKDYAGEEFLFNLDQYLSILATDKTRFINKVGEAGGGQYIINHKHIFEEITAASLENIIRDKFGSKAMRIFRYIRERRYVEEGQIQQVVMIPAKECKLLTFQLMENNFISLQELRKSMVPTAPSKAVYLFYVNLDAAVRFTVGLCLRSLINVKTRLELEGRDNERLVEKEEKVQNILQDLRAESAEQDQIDEVEEMLTPPEREALSRYWSRVDQLTAASLHTEHTLFILNTYLRYSAS